MLRILSLNEAQDFVTRKTVRLAEAEQTVAPILEAVRARGDEALLEYARKFDGFEGASLTVSTAGSRVSAEFQGAIEIAARNIREYAELQLPREVWVEFPDGRRLGTIVRPLESMGAYIPAGRYPLPSTLLMTVIPAQVAGVRTICVTSPHPSTEILAVAEFLGYPATPRAVVINEALEIARKFSTPESVQFINGVLDSVGKDVAP